MHKIENFSKLVCIVVMILFLSHPGYSEDQAEKASSIKKAGDNYFELILPRDCTQEVKPL